MRQTPPHVVRLAVTAGNRRPDRCPRSHDATSHGLEGSKTTTEAPVPTTTKSTLQDDILTVPRMLCTIFMMHSMSGGSSMLWRRK